MNLILPRDALVQRIRNDSTGTVLVCAPAGAGKTYLLRMVADRIGVAVCTLQSPRLADVVDGWLIWDVPVHTRAVRLPAQIAESVEHLIIASRPEQRLTGLTRRILHGEHTEIDGRALSLDAGDMAGLGDDVADRLRAGYAGWPAFIPLAIKPDDTLVSGYLAENILAHLTPAQTTSLTVWLENPTPEPRYDWRDALPPFLCAEPHMHPVLIAALRDATAHRLRAFTNSGAVTEVANTLEFLGRPLAAITLLLDHGHEAHAAQILEHSQGLELIYHSDLATFSQTILRFSQEMIATNETVLFTITRTLMKMGEMTRVRHLVVKHLGSDYLDPLKVLTRGSRFSFAARRFRLNMMISEDMTPTDTMLQRLGDFMADYPVGDDQKWAAFYNALLEFENRRRNFREAEAAAARALVYFRKSGGHALLEFFIHLHLTVLHLMNGDVMLAIPAANAARERLDAVPHAAESEHRMMRLLDAAIAYEEGHPQKMVTFTQTDFQDFAGAEIWPSLFFMATHYAAHTIMTNFPATIRRGFLDVLWIHLAERLNLYKSMQILTATAYQNEGRWAEAEVIWAEFPCDDSIENLRRIEHRDEIALAMTKLRHACFGHTPDMAIENRIKALLANPKTTLREKIVLTLWMAHVNHQRRDTAGARRNLQSALTATVRLGCFGVLSEQRIFLAPLLRERRIRSHVETSRNIRAALAIYAAPVNSPKAKARSGGLTEREAQMLQLIADGYTNKRISQTLNIAEPTVKFHLGHLYAKLGCQKRAQAIQAAHSLGWL